MKFLKNNTLRLLSVATLLIIFASCADLAVENDNSPLVEDVLASPTDLEALIPTGFVSWWQTATNQNIMGSGVNIDMYTCSWGNFDMRNRGEEPRITYDNTPTANSGTRGLTEGPWYGMYGAMSQANDVLSALTSADAIFDIIPSQETGVTDANYTDMVKASAKFLQGISLGYIGLYFDQGYVLDETFDPTNETATLVPYADVLAAADVKLAEAATIAAGLRGVTLGDGYINGFDDMTMDGEFIELVKTWRARLLVLAPRDVAGVATTDWATVKSLTADGLTFDFSPEGDDNFWYHYLNLYGNLGNWVRPDQRIIALMDPSQPSGYPVDGTNPGEATSDDARLTSDFEFDSPAPYPPARGFWFYSNYKSIRYDYHTFSLADGPMNYVLKAENDLMYAEAVIRTSDAANRQAAVNAINNTRVDRGSLTPLTIVATDAVILAAIQYERTIETYSTALTTSFGDARRFNTYQPGSLQHFPVPAGELLILLKDLYTFGGAKVSPDNPYLVAPKKINRSPVKVQY